MCVCVCVYVRACVLACVCVCVLNQTSAFDLSMLNLIPNWAVNMYLIQPPNVDKVRSAVN